MRELKFRIWNKDEKKMLFFDGIFNKISLYKPIMQFSGTYDKDKKEIYEGDIVEFSRKSTFCKNAKCADYGEIEYGIKFCPSCGKKIKDSDFITRAEITFNKGSFILEYEDDEGYFTWNICMAEVYIDWVKVIGNIFENKSLLKRKSKK